MSGLLLALIAAALFGASMPASKLLLEDLAPFQLAGLLYLGAALSRHEPEARALSMNLTRSGSSWAT